MKLENNPSSKNHKASVLAVSLIIMGVMIVVALGISFSSLQSRKSSIGSSKSNVAFQNADSGVEVVMQRIKNASGNISTIDSDCNGIIEVANKYRVELKDSADPPAVITDCARPVSDIANLKSTGYSSQDSRAIEVAVAQSGGSVKAWFSWSRASGTLAAYGVNNLTINGNNRPAVTFLSPMLSPNYAVICNATLGGAASEESVFTYGKTVNGFYLQANITPGEDAINFLDCVVLGN